MKILRLISLSGLIGLSISAFTVNAYTHDADDNDALGLFSQANGWTQLADNDGYTQPGYGGQDFDAEYLFYKYDDTNNDLSIGLQAGFDLIDGRVRYDHQNYYSGDLALSFDGDTTGTNGSGFEYAVDFGLFTKDSDGNKVSGGYDDGLDTAGLYKDVTWNSDILYTASSPFAMDDGTLMSGALSANDYGSEVTGDYWSKSFYRVVTFNLDDIVGDSSKFTVDTHWTMSCGNDSINGNVLISRNDTQVPEPSISMLFGLGSLGLFASAASRRRKKLL